MTAQKWKKDSTEVFGVSYEYPDSGNNKVVLPSAMVNGTKRIAYTYDNNGNITVITDSSGTTSYVYDEMNRLVRENNAVLNKTITYAYDMGGNLTEKKEYAFTTGTLPAAATKTVTGTFDTAWKDKLLSWDGVAMTYDGCGNMLIKGSTTYTWTQGRKLAGVSNGQNIQYFYDHTGNRVKKVVGGTTTEFRVAGRLLLSEKRSDDTLQFHYDTNANLFSVLIDGTRYLYVKNIQNDIIGLIDTNGNQVVEYKYDSWGNTVSITGSKASTVGAKNPFRYRGYYLDAETGLYYVGSRYYDPEICRWINTDNRISGIGGDILGYNMFVYCMDNPVNMSDPTGNWPKWLETAAKWVNNHIVQPVEDFVDKTINYLTIPSKEEHYSRNENNIKFPEKYDKTFFKEWDDSVSANCHQFSAPNRDNIKYVSPDGKYEAIYDVNGKLVTDPRDVGTYNFVSPNEDAIGHVIKDVIPWIRYKNSPDDSTKRWQRILSFIGIYI